jgi:hypothetical protein
MNHFTSGPSIALQVVRIRHAELSAQAHEQRIRRQGARRLHRSRR